MNMPWREVVAINATLEELGQPLDMTIREFMVLIDAYTQKTEPDCHEAAYERNDQERHRVLEAEAAVRKEKNRRSEERAQARLKSVLGPARFSLTYRTPHQGNHMIVEGRATDEECARAFELLPTEVRLEFTRMGLDDARFGSQLRQAIDGAPREVGTTIKVTLAQMFAFWSLHAETPGRGHGDYVTLGEGNLLVSVKWAEQTTTVRYYPAEEHPNYWMALPEEAQAYLRSAGITKHAFSSVMAELQAWAFACTDEGFVPNISIEFPGACDEETLSFLPVVYRASGDGAPTIEGEAGNPMGFSVAARRFILSAIERLEGAVTDHESRIALASQMAVDAGLAFKTVTQSAHGRKTIQHWLNGNTSSNPEEH